MSANLLKNIDIETIKELGFIEENDNSGDPRGIDYNMRTEKFHLMIDPWFDVKLARLDIDTTYIILQCDTKFELEEIIDWIQ